MQPFGKAIKECFIQEKIALEIIQLFVCVFVCVCFCVCVFVCAYVCLCVCIEIGNFFSREFNYLKHWDIRKNCQENYEMEPKHQLGPSIVTGERL